MREGVFTQQDGFQAIVLLGNLCKEILEDGCDPEKLRAIATEGAKFMQLTQDKMIDAGSINPARIDCHSKDDPQGFFEQQLSLEEFVEVCSTERARLAPDRLIQQADQAGA